MDTDARDKAEGMDQDKDAQGKDEVEAEVEACAQSGAHTEGMDEDNSDRSLNNGTHGRAAEPDAGAEGTDGHHSMDCEAVD